MSVAAEVFHPGTDSINDLRASLDALHATSQSSTVPIPLSYQEALSALQQAQTWTQEHPYCLHLYILTAQRYLNLDYPDLAAGAAYKALLLSDAVRDESDEYHEQAVEALKLEGLSGQQGEARDMKMSSSSNIELGDSDEQTLEHAQAVVESHYLPLIYDLLIRSLLACGGFQTAQTYCQQAVKLYPNDVRFRVLDERIIKHVSNHFGTTSDDLRSGEYSHPTTWPDSGYVRRERYPWNFHEPDRLCDLSRLNELMQEVAPRLEVLATELPDLTDPTAVEAGAVTTQLGVFAKEDIAAGEILLNETSLLTANNKLQDALCDACSVDLPQLNSAEADDTVCCPDCEVVFCSQSCHDQAAELYHPALCGADVEAIAKDVPAAQAADALYSLLLLRALALAETQHLHPLDLKEVHYIWGDFHNLAPSNHYPPINTPSDTIPLTLPFSFDHNIRLPFHMLEKMSINIFTHPHYDVWVFNTLYAKFRGTASARLSGLGGRAIRGPEVSAVHPLWCLANHSCDPNVSWEWGGSIKFRAREEGRVWKRDGGEGKEVVAARKGGIRKGEEVLNHYCDIDLPVSERREWAKGALGGVCRCKRCLWESGEDPGSVGS